MYNANINIKSDTCWKNAKDNNNKNIEDYEFYNNTTARENKPTGSLPSFSLDHINLRGRPGYGLADDYLIDNYSMLRNNEEAMTRDRCPIQLITRIFTGGPRLTGATGDIEKELDVLSGSDTRTMPTYSVAEQMDQPYRCNKSLMEVQMNNIAPLLDCIKEVQKPDHIIPTWTRGGDDTRSYLNKVKYSKCSFS